MSLVRKFVLPLFLTLLLLIAVSPTSATGPTTTRQIIRETVHWSMTAEQCYQLHVPVAGTGQKYEVITTTVYPNGSSRVVDNALITGTAADSTGRYRFVYANRLVLDIPAGSGPVKAFMIDSFVMGGSGSAHVNASFVWRWTYTPPAEAFPITDNFQPLVTIGDPISPAGEAHCDPL